MHSLVPETARKYQLSFLIECRKIDIGWDDLQFLCISLCRIMLKHMSYPFSAHAERLILAERVLDFCSLAMPETAQKYELPFLRACRKVDISWDGLQFSCISLCRRLLIISSYPFSEHAARLILAETVFNFYAFVYAGDCSKVSVILSHSMQKDWYWLRRSSKSMLCFMPSLSYPFSEHAEKLISAETVFKLYALSYTGPS